MARMPETPAGSESTARAERDVSRDLGDPPRSWSGEPDRVCQLKGASTGRQMSRWKSGPPVVLSARESRVHGEAAGQSECPGWGNIPYTQR